MDVYIVVNFGQKNIKVLYYVILILIQTYVHIDRISKIILETIYVISKHIKMNNYNKWESKIL